MLLPPEHSTVLHAEGPAPESPARCAGLSLYLLCGEETRAETGALGRVRHRGPRPRGGAHWRKVESESANCAATEEHVSPLLVV